MRIETLVYATNMYILCFHMHAFTMGNYVLPWEKTYERVKRKGWERKEENFIALAVNSPHVLVQFEKVYNFCFPIFPLSKRFNVYEKGNIWLIRFNILFMNHNHIEGAQFKLNRTIYDKLEFC